MRAARGGPASRPCRECWEWGGSVSRPEPGANKEASVSANIKRPACKLVENVQLSLFAVCKHVRAFARRCLKNCVLACRLRRLIGGKCYYSGYQ